MGDTNCVAYEYVYSGLDYCIVIVFIKNGTQSNNPSLHNSWIQKLYWNLFWMHLFIRLLTFFLVNLKKYNKTKTHPAHDVRTTLLRPSFYRLDVVTTSKRRRFLTSCAG